MTTIILAHTCAEGYNHMLISHPERNACTTIAEPHLLDTLSI